MAISNKFAPLMRRIVIVVVVIICVTALVIALWRPGLDIRDGRNDRGSNAVWLAHGWLGADEWFINNGKTNEFRNKHHPEKYST